ncbi:MAG: twin-arginine translocase TatA/TatE family subunit [Candidatus Eremiobacterota bacterium]
MDNLILAWVPGPMELVLLLVLALIIFGPKRLPEIGEATGKAISSFKQASTAQPPAPPPPSQAARAEDTEASTS